MQSSCTILCLLRPLSSKYLPTGCLEPVANEPRRVRTGRTKPTVRAGTLVGLVIAMMAAARGAASEPPLGPDAEAQRTEAVPADTSKRYGGSLGSGS